MAFLARAGFDVWAMDMSGYGSSPRPMMDDPCNVDPKQQDILIKRPLAAPCAPHYPVKFKTIRNDWDEIDSVVDHIRQVTGAAKVSIVGWSAGGPRAGGYAALYPDKVNRVLLYAPGAPRSGFKPAERPDAGFPVALQTRAKLEKERWDPDVRCSGQVEPGVRDALWTQVMQWDPIGASWGPEEGVMRAPTMMNGWSTEQANALKMPVMVIVGEYDEPDQRRVAYEAAGSADKVFVKVACASHFMLWEKQHKALHDASLQWLRDGKFVGASSGAFEIDADGKAKKAE
jgi:pimeloyl-ACP methyl ester carboxylesterase